MITKRKLREINSQELPLHILEQDYIQALFLEGLYSEVDSLVFKGGTFLRHVHGLDRFSEDLDFTRNGDIKIARAFKKTASKLDSYGIEAEIDDVAARDYSILARLRYRGPLYTGSEKSLGSMEIEVSTREDIFLEPVWERAFYDYPEVRVTNILGLKEEEMLVEKLRALSTRRKGRDLYDVWFLLKQGLEPDKKLFERKMEVVKSPPNLTINVTKSEWKNDLEILLERPPKYEKVKKNVIQKLREYGYEI